LAKDSLKLLGLVIGLLGALALSQMVAILLFDVTVYDPATFVAKARSLLSSHNPRKATARRRGDRQ